MKSIGIVAIGRNEGERLRLCLASVVGREMPVVYVDSDSSDNSVAVAKSLGAEVVNLDMTVPFSAARARNEGFERLARISPQVAYVQFVDGDCEIVAGWIERAAGELDVKPDVAIVCGRRRERAPEASIYNRLADIEWDRPPGIVKSCGGDAMMRADVFKSAGGFNPTVVAGEEPELCQRLRASGHKILRIDAEMTLHDSAMFHFRQWWKRQIRSGYGAMDVAYRFKTNAFVKQVRSARTWTVGLLTLLVLPTSLALAYDRRLSAVPALAIFLLYLLQILRISISARSRLKSPPAALAYGVLTMVGKWANLIGQFRFRRDILAGRSRRLIEYKGVTR